MKSWEERFLKLEGEVDALKQELSAYKMSNDDSIESLFYSLLNDRVNQKSAAAIVELACIEYFNVKRKDFHEVNMGIYGDVSTMPPEIRRLSEARKWHMSIMTNMLHETSYSLSKNYSKFYHFQKVKNHMPVYMGALNPVTEQDQQSRKVLFDIGNIIKRISEEEGILDERLEFM